MFQRLCARLKTDSGSALVVVVISVVFLSLWFGSVAILSATSHKIVDSALGHSNARASTIARAIQWSMQKLTPSKVSRYGISSNTCTGKIPDYTDAATGEVISISCAEADASGSTYGNTLVLTGTAPSTGTGQVGMDGGMAFANLGATSNCKQTDTNRYVVYGGVYNASGAWFNTNCGNLELNLNAASYSDSGTSPVDPSLIAPATLNTPFNSSTCNWALGQRPASCTCPTNVSYTSSSGSYSVLTSPCTFDTAANLNPSDSSTNIGMYLKAVDSKIVAAPNQSATYWPSPPESSFTECNYVSSTTNRDGTVDYGTKAITWYPGVLNDSMLADLNAQSGGVSGASGCNSNKVAIIFTPGIYRFQPTNSSSRFEWKVKDNVKIFLGSPKSDNTASAATSYNTANHCDHSKAGGQFQFAGATFLQVYTGQVFLCPDSPFSGNPVFVAASHNLVDSSGNTVLGAWNPNDLANPDTTVSQLGDNTQAMLIIQTSGGASTGCAVCLVSEGLFYAPGASAYIYNTSNGRSTFGQGAVLKAVTVDGNGSAQNDVVDKPPVTNYNGDRHVQLRFWSKTFNKDLGIVQVTIKDAYGQNFGSGFSIDTWAVKW